MSQPETAFFPSMKSLILNTHHLFTEPLLYYRAVTAVLPVLSRIFLLILTPMVVWGQARNGFEHHAYSGATASLPAAAFVLSANPAAISGHRIHVYCHEYFGMDALRDGGISYQIESGNEGLFHGFAAEVHQFGFDLYQEVTLRAGATLSTGNARIGIAPSMMQTRIPQYGSALAVQSDIGFQYQVTESVLLGGVMRNVPLAKSGDFAVSSASSLHAGISYQPEQHLMILTEIIQTTGYQPDVHVGFHYDVHTGLSHLDILLALGYATNHAQWSAGVQTILFGLVTGISVRNHPVLGRSQGIGIGYAW